MTNNEKAKLAFYLFVIKDEKAKLLASEQQKNLASEYYESMNSMELIDSVLPQLNYA